MFLRLLYESFVRQRRRKLLAGIAILLGTTAVTAMLALATSIGDRIHRELAVYGANIVVTPKASNLDVKIAGVDIKPATGNAYLKESDLEKLHTIFWANNITGVSPELGVVGTSVTLSERSLIQPHARCSWQCSSGYSPRQEHPTDGGRSGYDFRQPGRSVVRSCLWQRRNGSARTPPLVAS